MDKNNKIDEDLSSFISESREIVDEIEPQLVKLGEGLERNETPDDETVNQIFRGFHTIKGTAAFYQLDSVVSLAHKSETLLEFFRSGHEPLNSSSTDVLCQVLDVMENLFELIEAGKGEEEAQDRIRSVIHRLNGRIDAVRKKTDNPCDEHVSESQFLETQDFKESHIRIGKYVMIFITESRVMMKQMMALTFISVPDGASSYRQDELDFCIDKLGIMADSAGFLGFNILSGHLEKALQWIRSKDKDTDVTRNDVMNFSDVCQCIMALLDGIEQSGIDREGITIELPEDTSKPNLYLSEDSECHLHDLNTVFLSETHAMLDALEKDLVRLREERLNRSVQHDIASIFHKIKGSAGLMGYDRLELLCSKAEAILEDVFDEMIFFDVWDVKALWETCRVIRQFLKILEDGIINYSEIPSAMSVLDRIRSGLSDEEKEREMKLPEMIRGLEPESIIPVTGEFIDDDEEHKGTGFGPNENHGTMEQQSYDSERKFMGLSGMESIPGGIERRKTDRRDIRVSIEKLDELINLVGELVIAENMVVKNPDIRGLELENFEKATAHLRKIIRDLQDVALAVRMIPISGIFRKMIRLVHDQSVKTGKKVKLKLLGEDTEIDKTVAELISDPLVHLVRNAIDHGIQQITSPDTNETDGWIFLEARHEGGEVLIIVKDTGQGLDKDKILEKALASGIVKHENLPLSDKDVFELIFHPGFSTRDHVTDFSGRGVGLDVVKRNLDKIKGRIDVFSRRGRGCSFVMRIPLTLAIIDGMLVRVGDSAYTIPLLSIRETIQVKGHQVTTTMDGQEMVMVRDEVIPVIRLHDIYGMGKDETNIEKGLVVVVEHQDDVAGLLIHDILGEQQAVIKGMSGYMNQVSGISGCTILGDGEVSLILDVGGLIQKAQNRETFQKSVGEATIH